MRASRLLSLLLLLQTRGRMTAQQLASELEVSVRTVYHDVEALGAAGAAWSCTQGRHLVPRSPLRRGDAHIPRRPDHRTDSLRLRIHRRARIRARRLLALLPGRVPPATAYRACGDPAIW